MNKNKISEDLISVCCAMCMLATMHMVSAQGVSAPKTRAVMSFKSATVTLLDPDDGFDPQHFWVHINPEGASYWSMTTTNLITYAFGIEPFQVTGPEWTSTDRYDIEAKFPDGADKSDDRTMLRSLLIDRFKLFFRVEQKELQGYQLVVGKHEDKLRPSPPDAKNGNVKQSQEPGIMRFEYGKMTMQELARSLRNCVGDGTQKIEDKTGKTGTYQVAFDCPMQRPGSLEIEAAGQQDESATARSLGALGLKLERHKFAQEVYVISHIERPAHS